MTIRACQELFAPGRETLSYVAYRKRGKIFALLPRTPRLRASIAHLLPAHSKIARLFRSSIAPLARLGVNFPGAALEVPFNASHPLACLLSDIAGIEVGPENPPVILPGNPGATSQRTILIPLDREGTPRGTVKAGFSEEARSLIRTEHQALSVIPPALQVFAPRPGPLIETPDFTAFGMEFIEGSAPPVSATPAEISPLLETWVDTAKLSRLDALPAWQALATTLGSAPEWLENLGSHSLHPALFHGDFAPWNIRVTRSGAWKALDWERGALHGPPAWDWFHFHFQPAILVKHASLPQLQELAAQILRDPFFLAYADKAGITSITGPLLNAYFLYNWHVLKPGDRADIAQELAVRALKNPSSF